MKTTPRWNNWNTNMRAAVYLGKLPSGQKVYRVPVQVLLNDSRDSSTWGDEPTEWYSVHAPSITDAANHVRDLYKLRAETEIKAYGPKGGHCSRYIGWESAVWAAMLEEHSDQLQLL
jgi:hypothetical protein